MNQFRLSTAYLYFIYRYKEKGLTRESQPLFIFYKGEQYYRIVTFK